MSPQTNLAITIGVSIFIYALACHASVYYRQHTHTPAVIWLKRTICHSRHGIWIYQGVRFVYFIGVPYFALRQGIASAQMMGLGEWNGKVEDILISVGLAGTAVVLFSLAWRSQARSLPVLPGKIALRKQHWLATALDVLYMEVHWAFYRSGPILWLGGDYYAGSLLGLVLIWVEGLLNPSLRTDLRLPETSLRVVIGWSTSLCMTMIFVFSHSLWIVTVAHWIVEIGSAGIGRTIDSKRASRINDHIRERS